MERRKLLIAAAAFLVFATGGFYLAFTASPSQAEQKFVSKMNVTVDSDTEIATASFDGRKIDLMHEDRARARFYLDFDRDGSFDLELDDLTHDGQIRKYNRTVTLANVNYRLYFRYRDDPEKTGDSWLTLYRVLETR